MPGLALVGADCAWSITCEVLAPVARCDGSRRERAFCIWSGLCSLCRWYLPIMRLGVRIMTFELRRHRGGTGAEPGTDHGSGLRTHAYSSHSVYDVDLTCSRYPELR